MEIFYKLLLPAITYILLSPIDAGLDERPPNSSCLAEELATSFVITDAFPGISFQLPIAMKQNSSDSTRIFVAEKRGTIQLLINGVLQSSPFLDIRSQITNVGERGLLGLAFHPDYSSNGFFYVSYIDLDSDSVISRYTRSTTNPDVADPGSEVEILTLDQPFFNHNGGNIEFGPDEYLYIGFGDGGSGGDPLNNGQDLSNWHGSILRIDVNGTAPYTIPSGNPFNDQSCNQINGTGICPEIFAYGLRNPWRWSFDSVSGELWLGDVGQNEIEEISVIENGGNYGWRCYEGTEPFNTNGCNSVTAIPPIIQYSHILGRCSVTGGYVYRGTAATGIEGFYIYGDLCTGEIWGISTNNLMEPTPVHLATSSGSIYSFAEDNDGEIYILSSNGNIGRLESDTSGTNIDPVPTLLSETGCVDPADPTQPAPGLVPYDINAPFWSDGAQKSRWFALPDGYKISNTEEDWLFPPTSVLIKNFTIGGKLIETRHLKHHPNGAWAGYTYEWNGTETEANRVVEGKTVTVNNGTATQDWVFPSETECLVCHTAAAGYVLGAEPVQLNKDFTYPTTGRTDNQLNTAEKIGLILNRIKEQPSNLPSLVNPYDSEEDIGARARAWLHSNCSGCHRPGGNSNSSMDLRESASLNETNMCDISANTSSPGWPTVLLSPGDATNSLVYFRANSRDITIQMPPIGSTIIDSQAMEVLESWINSLSGCTP